MGYRTYTCPIARDCGGCELLSVPYPIQLQRKQTRVEELFAKMLLTDGVELNPIRGMDEASGATPGSEPLAYRYKAATPFAPIPRAAHKRYGGNRIASGFYARGTHQIIPCDSCLVEASYARETLEAVAKVASDLRIRAYDEDSCQGSLRHAIVRMGYATKECMLTLVCAGEHLAREEVFISRLLDATPWISTVVLNTNSRQTNAMLGSKSRVLYGDGIMHDSLLDCSFAFGPTSFFQTNPAQTEVLYRLALNAAFEGDADSADFVPHTLLDAYCGVGTIGICAAVRARNAEGAHGTEPLQIVGVESVREAVHFARMNAKVNGVSESCRYVAADATEFMLEATHRSEKYDIVVLDPPRAGATPEFLSALSSLLPKRVVYVSCNPETQARDIAQLRGAGYRLTNLTPVDMFPHTKHIETVASLSCA